MDIAVLLSGGKDSALALYRALKDGHKVKYLVTAIPKNEESWMFHFPNTEKMDLFAAAADIPLIKLETEGVKEEELEDLGNTLSGLDIDAVVSGAVNSNYQRTRIENLCEELELQSIAPLWGENHIKLINEMLKLNFEILVTGVYSYGFTKEWLGKKLDRSALDALINLNKNYQISIIGEGGEYETFVLDTPYFNKKIHIIKREVSWDGYVGTFLIKEAKLLSK